MPIATTIVGDIYTTEERAKIQGYLSSVWGISAVSGPVIGGLIVQYLDWKYVFWVNVPLGIFAMLGSIYFFMSRSGKRKFPSIIKGLFYLHYHYPQFYFGLVEGGKSFGRLSFSSIVLIVGSWNVYVISCVVERIAERSDDAICNLEESGHLICKSGVVDNRRHFDWYFLLFTDICDGCHGTACNHCWFYIDSDVHRLADCVLCCGASINPIWNV